MRKFRKRHGQLDALLGEPARFADPPKAWRSAHTPFSETNVTNVAPGCAQYHVQKQLMTIVLASRVGNEVMGNNLGFGHCKPGGRAQNAQGIQHAKTLGLSFSSQGQKFLKEPEGFPVDVSLDT